MSSFLKFFKTVSKNTISVSIYVNSHKSSVDCPLAKRQKPEMSQSDENRNVNC